MTAQVEETVAGVQALIDMARRLDELVSAFRLEPDEPVSLASQPRPANRGLSSAA